MKFFTTAACALLLGVSAHAGERTIKTRDGKIYTKAEITETGPATVKISHEGGITVVPLENLPTALQKELGYKTLADRQVEMERTEEQKQQQQTIESQGRDEALKTAREKKLKDAFYAKETATQAEANAFATQTRDALLAKLGEPLRTAHTDIPGGGFTTLFYDERKPTRTQFVIRDGATVVSAGVYKGVTIQTP